MVRNAQLVSQATKRRSEGRPLALLALRARLPRNQVSQTSALLVRITRIQEWEAPLSRTAPATSVGRDQMAESVCRVRPANTRTSTVPMRAPCAKRASIATRLLRSQRRRVPTVLTTRSLEMEAAPSPIARATWAILDQTGLRVLHVMLAPIKT